MSDQPYTIRTYSSRSEWLAARKLSIGASESYIVCGVPGRLSPWAMWSHKRDTIPEPDNDNEFMEAGRRHEPTLGKWFEDKSKLKVRLLGTGTYDTYVSNERPHMSCSLDAIVVDSNRPVELKCAWRKRAKEWQQDGKIPMAYQIQVQHQLYVTGADMGYIFVLLNGLTPLWHKVQRHDAFIERLCYRCDLFWKHVTDGTSPDIDGHFATTQALKETYKVSDGSEIELPDEFIEHANSFDEAAAAEVRAKKQKDSAANALRQRMGPAEIAKLPDGRVFRWRGSPRRFTRVK